MIVKNGETITFDWKEDYAFLSSFDELVKDYCKDNDELRKKILTNFFKAFVMED